MSAPPSTRQGPVAPLVGYNDNVAHRGHVYHVQTEDSGPRRPHVITHLFADGGRIVTSTKTSYEEHVGTDQAEDHVRSLMRAQHRAMLTALQSGEFDDMLAEPVAPAPAPAVAAPAASPSEPVVEAVEAPQVLAGQLAEFAPEGAPPAEPDAPVPLTTPVDKPPRRKPSTEPEVLPPVGEAVPVDVLERAAAKAESELFRGVPPPPKATGGHRPRKPTPFAGAGAYSYLASGGKPPTIPRPDVAPESVAPPRRRRYPQTSPGRRKGAAEHAADDAAVDGADRSFAFGERFLTNRSLDEVILEFLARHFEP